MTDDLAGRLLDAQVEWIVAELTGEGLADLLAHDVDDLLAIGAGLPLASVIPLDAAKTVLARVVDATGDSAVLISAVDLVADAIYDLPAADEHELGAVVGRAHVEELVDKVLSLHQLQDAAMERLQQSPAVGAVAAAFVGKLVADVVQQNRERVERLPGARSLMSIGFGAANKVRSAVDDTFLGDAAGKGAQYAIKRTNAVTRDVLRQAPVRDAVLEVWDLQAAEAVSDLRRFVSRADVRELAQIVRASLADARRTEYARALLDECVDAFYETHGSTDVAALLVDLGLDRDDLLVIARAVATPLLAALRESGDLDRIVRTRLAPFFASDALRGLLA